MEMVNFWNLAFLKQFNIIVKQSSCDRMIESYCILKILMSDPNTFTCKFYFNFSKHMQNKKLKSYFCMGPHQLRKKSLLANEWIAYMTRMVIPCGFWMISIVHDNKIFVCTNTIRFIFIPTAKVPLWPISPCPEILILNQRA